MKKLFLIALSLMSLIVPTVALAKGESMRGGERVELAKGEVISSDYFAGGELVMVTGHVLGDAYVAGGTVNVEGVIDGDLLIAGGTLNIRGDVLGDVRAAGGTIIISGKIGGNLTVVGGTVQLTETAELAGSLVGGVGTLDVSAPVGKGMSVVVGALNLASTVGGDVNYWSETEISQGQETSVAGQVYFHQAKQDADRESHWKAAMLGFGSAISLFTLVGSFILGLIVLKLAPKYATGMTNTVSDRPWLALFVGFAAVILTPVLVVILGMTVIGIPLAFVLLLIFILVCIFGKIATALFVGTRVMKYFSRRERPYLSLFLGLVVLMILCFIPVLGWAVSSVLYLMGLGGLLLYKREFFDMLQTKKVIK